MVSMDRELVVTLVRDVLAHRISRTIAGVSATIPLAAGQSGSNVWSGRGQTRGHPFRVGIQKGCPLEGCRREMNIQTASTASRRAFEYSACAGRRAKYAYARNRVIPPIERNALFFYRSQSRNSEETGGERSLEFADVSINFCRLREIPYGTNPSLLVFSSFFSTMVIHRNVRVNIPRFLSLIRAIKSW